MGGGDAFRKRKGYDLRGSPERDDGVGLEDGRGRKGKNVEQEPRAFVSGGVEKKTKLRANCKLNQGRK